MEHRDENDLYGQPDANFVLFNVNGEEYGQAFLCEASQQLLFHGEQSVNPEDDLVESMPLHPTEQNTYTSQGVFALSGEDPHRVYDYQQQDTLDNQGPSDAIPVASSALTTNPSASRGRKEKVKKRKAPEGSALDSVATNPELTDSCPISLLLEDLNPVEVKELKSHRTNGHIVDCQYPYDIIGSSVIRYQETSPILANTNRTRESHFQWPFILVMNCTLDGIILRGVSIVIQKDTREINIECLAKYHFLENEIHVTDIKLRKEIRTGEEYSIRFYARIEYSHIPRTFICSWESHPVLPYCNPQQIPRLISSYYYKNFVKESHNREESFRQTINSFHAKFTSERLDCVRYLSDQETRRVCEMYGVDYKGLDNMQHFWEWFIQAMDTIHKFIGPKYCEQIKYSREGEPPPMSNIFDCFITRRNAEQKLMYSPPGSLLIRVSTSDVTQIVASFRDERNRYHFQFNKNMFETSTEDGGPPLLRKIASTPFYSELDRGSRLDYLKLITPTGMVRLVDIFQDFSGLISGSEQRYN